jgi:DNA-binding transcriptional regulator YhcF (GntR family)
MEHIKNRHGGMSGYVRIHRTLIDHPAFRTDAEAMAFAWLVAKASWRSSRVRYKGHGVCLERGQLAISVREFAMAMDRDKAWIERLLKRLKNEGMVETAAETGVTIVTICNYDKYQSECVSGETAAETQGETRARQTQDTEQRREKGKKKETIALADWVPVEPWEAFKRMRKGMKVPFTPDAERGILADLEKLRNEGHDLEKVLLKAVKRGWRGVFGDEDTKRAAVKIVRAMTPSEMHSSIRYHREVLGDEKRAKELEAELAEMVRGIAA